MSSSLIHDTGWLEGQQRAWDNKPLLRRVYGDFHRRIGRLIDPTLPGKILEVGAGIGNLKENFPNTWSTDLILNPKLDFVADAYELPLRSETLSHLVLVDVFHHLSAPAAFFAEARRVLGPRGRLILLEPYISLSSVWAYGVMHPEPIAWLKKINLDPARPSSRAFYAAQGNATRLFFKSGGGSQVGWIPFHREAFAGFSYLLCGGFSRPALYPESWYLRLTRLDQRLSRWPRLFGARCLLGFEKTAG